MRISGCHSSKIVAYDMGPVTIYVDYDDFMKLYKPFWKMYRKSMRGTDKEIRKGEYINPEYEPRYRVIDSMYHYLREQMKIADTVILSYQPFLNVGLGGPVHFDPFLEKGNCDIRDKRDILHRYILRRRESHSNGNAGWGGRLYFIPGEKQHFYFGQDWIT